MCVCCAFPLCDIHTQTQVALISTFNGRHEALMIASAQGCALVDLRMMACVHAPHRDALLQRLHHIMWL